MSLRNLNIYLRKDGRYEGRYKSKSGTIKYFYSRLEEVVARQMIIYIAHDFENEAQETESSKTDSARLAPFETKIKENHPDKSDTLEEMAKRWIEGKRKEDKESSVGIYANYIRLYILPKFGDKKVEDVKDAEADEYFQSLSKEGRESAQDDTTPSSKALSISTVNEAIRIMNCLMKFAAESGYSV
ncbi:MAG: hypothetical protein J6P05_00770, partial [Lachnospiraceae bacterium]|nr:hypothetical protein [Lachnospiraceae bacterium]